MTAHAQGNERRTERVTFRVTPEEKALLKQLAWEESRSVSDMLCQLIHRADVLAYDNEGEAEQEIVLGDDHEHHQDFVKGCPVCEANRIGGRYVPSPLQMEQSIEAMFSDILGDE
jgi:hypothetical protein